MEKNYINIEDFFDLPYCHVYKKNREGIYSECNDYQAKDAGFNKGIDMIGMTDKDMAWKNEAIALHLNDQKVLHTETPTIFLEGGLLASGNFAKVLSYKMPLYNDMKKVIGIFGISFILNDTHLKIKLLNNYSTLLNSFNQIASYHQLNSISDNHNLTNRQADCLYYLVKGMTAKEIARILSLSNRTVEQYIADIKDKLQCKSRSELISKALKMDFIKVRLLA